MFVPSQPNMDPSAMSDAAIFFTLGLIQILPPVPSDFFSAIRTFGFGSGVAQILALIYISHSTMYTWFDRIVPPVIVSG